MDRDDGVNDFLARIKELGAQRDREDEERTRQLEKEILAGRQARQDRRAGTYLLVILGNKMKHIHLFLGSLPFGFFSS